MRSFKLLFASLCLLLFIAACNVGPETKNTSSVVVNLPADSVEDEGWGADLQLSVINLEKRDTSDIYTLQAIYKNRPVGFLIEIPTVTDKDSKGFGSGIKIKNVGKQSDDFKNALAEIYKQKTDTVKKFVSSAEVAYVDLMQFSKSVAPSAKADPLYYKELKLFMMSENGEEGELYLNIDKEKKIVELREKDPEYRPVIIQLLSAR